ncbi:unnamed protein product [Rangifer tarandus platyrhynchus]|uniref:Secreted protein n=2 Tax=Rangifer tarandus platyrhynchus TaxID=3082113 RepID=A0ABN8Z9Q3_RANTA|nr:unnamed protein product [Rangifer tarandus platyrhynchus]
MNCSTPGFPVLHCFLFACSAAAAAAKSLQSCPTLCDPIDGSPPRLPRPWESPGKNTGVGCHFLLQCVKVKLLSHVRLLATPWTAARQAFLSFTIFYLLVLLSTKREYLPPRIEYCNYFRFLLSVLFASLYFEISAFALRSVLSSGAPPLMMMSPGLPKF